MTNNTKKKQYCPDPDTIREMLHLQKMFGSDLRNYYHSGRERSELPYTARDAAGARTKKRNRK